jgi:glycosyltransferase involved in cell wall biosynthesis
VISVKILWIKQGLLFPLDAGGKIRTWHILKELAKEDDITALTFYPSYQQVSPNDVEHGLSRLITMPTSMPEKFSLRYRMDYLRGLASQVPYVVRQYAAPQVRERVRELLREQRFDVVVCDFLFPCLNLPDRGPCPQVLFAHNAETMIWKRHFKVARNPLWKLVTGLEYWKMRRFESRRCNLFDHLIAVSDVDRRWFTEFIPVSRVSVLPTGVDLNYFRPSAVQENPRKLVFTGSMDWLANEDAILFFAEKILPLVLRAAPDVTLTVAGRNPTKKLKLLARHNPRVHLTGTVPDVRPYVAEAAVYVLPLRVGGGTRLKIFEAMAMGKAMVSTEVGAEGLPIVPGTHLLIEDDPQNFAAAVVRLLRDDQLRRQFGQAARQLVESRYGWPEVGRTFRHILERVTAIGREQKTACVLATNLERV